MTTIDHDELTRVAGGWCIPTGETAAEIFQLTGGRICIGFSNQN